MKDKINWYKKKDGNIEIYMDQDWNIICVANHDTKRMFTSKKFQKEVDEEFMRHKNGSIMTTLTECEEEKKGN